MIGLNRRRMMGGEKLPYDAEIEYLESSGTQYIDTMVAPTLDTEIQCVVIPITANVNVLNTDLQNSFGIHITDWSSGSWACYFGNEGYIPRQGVSNFKYNIPQSVVLNYQKVTIDGVEYSINATSMSGSTMYMFKSTWKDKDNTRICSLKIKQNNIIVRDYIPVRKGNVGYMYDKVSKQLFGNSGTGEFILGPDVNSGGVNA